jgi:hypothetical protein
MLILTESKATWEDLIEFFLFSASIESIEIYSKTGSYIRSEFGKGKFVTISGEEGFHLEAPPNRLTIRKKSVRKIERDLSGWDVLFTNGDNWRIHWKTNS